MRTRALLVGLALAAGARIARSSQEPVPVQDPFPHEIVPIDAIRGFLMEGPFVEPTGVCFDPWARELIVVDSKSARIGIFDEQGVPIFAFGGHSVLSDPRKVQVDRAGTIYVVDSESTSIKVFSYRGEPRPALRCRLPAEGDRPPRDVRVSAFAIDHQGDVVVVDAENPQVLVYDRHMSLRTVLRSVKDGPTLEAPCAVAVATDGRIAVIDMKARPIQILDPRGRLLAAFGKRDIGLENFTAPLAVRFDDAGHLFVVDMLRHDVKVFDGEGRLLNQFGGWFSPETRGRAPGEMLYPCDIALTPEGRVFVAERYGARVQIFDRQPRASSRSASANEATR